MMKHTAISTALGLCLGATAMAGPDYDALKNCLDQCLRTTEDWTWARVACEAECELTYVDSKISFHAGFDPRSTGWTESGGLHVLAWGTMPVVQVGFMVVETPQHRPIQRVEFRLFGPAHPPASGGVLLATVPGNNQIQGPFIATIVNDASQVGRGGFLVAEIHYTGVGDVDDVGVVGVWSGEPPCPADFNGDGFLDFFDYDEYVSCFETGACPPGMTADFNGDGFADFFDYDAFVSAFEAGC